MLDIYSFSRGKNSINSDLTTQMYLGPYMSHSFHNGFFWHRRAATAISGFPTQKEVNAKAYTSGKPQRPQLFFVLTSFNCSFSTLFGFVGHLVGKDISLISDNF